MNELNTGINSGVEGSTGTEFQKNCVLHILFENYEYLKSQKYFICIEHHDDFLFCFLNQNEIAERIEAFQAKKSTNAWTNSQLIEPLKKIIKVGEDLNSDSILKIQDYSHTLNFISNHSIKLAAPNEIGLKPKTLTTTINETNSEVKYLNLHENISGLIKNELKNISVSDISLEQLENLKFIHIDIPKAVKKQKDTLVGQFRRVFGEKVYSNDSAIDTLLLLLREAENTYNQNGIAQLNDKSKRVESARINGVIDIITTKSMAFKVWREKKSSISEKMKIPILSQKEFELHFDNSFDYFKDLTQVEHHKILRFVNENKPLLANCYTDEDCVEVLHSQFVRSKNTQLSELELKASIFAAYIQMVQHIA